MNTRFGFVACLAMAIIAMVQDASVTYGQITYTNAQANGNWATPATWSLGVPTDLQAAAINGGFTVTLDQPGATTNLLDVGTISGETGNLTISGGTLFVTDPNAAEPNIPSFRVGTANGATGNVTMTAGEVFIGDAAGSAIGNGELLIGDNGTGTATVSGGTLQAADEIFVGLFAGSDGNLNVSGGSVEALGRSILLGFGGGNGSLNVSGTGSVRANFDLLVGMFEGSTAEITQSGGTIEAGFIFTNFAAGGAGSTVNMSMIGGVLNSRIAVVLGQGAGTTTMTHSAGAINVLVGNGDMVVSDSFDPGNPNTSTYNISGTATVNLLHNMILSAFDEGTGIVNQTGGTINATDNVVVGRAESGTWNMSGGTINTANVFLGDFDTSLGTMNISGGDVNVTGSFNVGGALASNAAPDRVEPTGPADAQGQALDANGALIVSGSAATIDVGGNFRANPDDKSDFRSDVTTPGADNSATLGFEIFNSSGTSLINVAGIADLDGAVIDLDLMGGFTPSVGATFDLLKAASFGSTGVGTTENIGTGEGYTLAAEDAGVFSLAVIAGGGFETLRATFLGASANDADFDNDGDVDGADFLTWQRGLGLSGAAATNAAGNANGDTVINGADLTVWRNEFGTPSVPAVGAVPEPGATALLLIAAAGFAASRTAARSGRRLA